MIQVLFHEITDLTLLLRDQGFKILDAGIEKLAKFEASGQSEDQDSSSGQKSDPRHPSVAPKSGDKLWHMRAAGYDLQTLKTVQNRIQDLKSAKGLTDPQIDALHPELDFSTGLESTGTDSDQFQALIGPSKAKTTDPNGSRAMPMMFIAIIDRKKGTCIAFSPI
jgi:hypothetical protein